MKRGQVVVTHDSVTSDSTLKMNIGPFNALLVHHKIEGATAGGYVSLNVSPTGEDGTYISNHNAGTNIKAADTPTSYVALFEALLEYIEVDLHVTDGTHTVTVQPLLL